LRAALCRFGSFFGSLTHCGKTHGKPQENCGNIGNSGRKTPGAEGEITKKSPMENCPHSNVPNLYNRVVFFSRSIDIC